LQHEVTMRCHLASWVGGYSSLQSSMLARGARGDTHQCSSGMDNSLADAVSHEAPPLPARWRFCCGGSQDQWRMRGA
jgi:hypothetical protein